VEDLKHPQIGLRIAFHQLTRAEANRAVRDLRRDAYERAGIEIVASAEKEDLTARTRAVRRFSCSLTW
jgi:hypothetical protein